MRSTSMRFAFALPTLLLVACAAAPAAMSTTPATSASPAPAPPASAPVSSSASARASVPPLASGAPHVCASGETRERPTRVCVRGRPDGDGEEVTPETIAFEVLPPCRGTGSGANAHRSFEVFSNAPGELTVDAPFCMLPPPTSGGPPPLPDCNALPVTKHQVAIPPGTYTLIVEGKRATLTVPSRVPLGGQCVDTY